MKTANTIFFGVQPQYDPVRQNHPLSSLFTKVPLKKKKFFLSFESLEHKGK